MPTSCDLASDRWIQANWAGDYFIAPYSLKNKKLNDKTDSRPKIKMLVLNLILSTHDKFNIVPVDEQVRVSHVRCIINTTPNNKLAATNYNNYINLPT
jgi:hypothetical protein